MDTELPESSAEALSSEILSGMREWNVQHPNATLTEIEQALDERWYRLRARMLHDLALEREVATWQPTSPERPSCPDCGRALIRRGRQRSAFASANGDITPFFSKEARRPQPNAATAAGNQGNFSLQLKIHKQMPLWS